MQVRKFKVKDNTSQDERVVTLIQEKKWIDNRSPDFNQVDRSHSYERIAYLLKRIKKNRECNPEGSIVVHCR